ncbi:hypothetical protein GCM10010433_16730 [Streptomyces pulveraceus]|uniref:Uncharacterized protein n=1 Tax=Streptomyces pulveraceus TaxID=68258 RepID=A0ABW1GMF5_9ACTN
MKNIVAGHVAVTATEFTELALAIDLGIDLELFTGPATESVMERAARLDVAREVVAELYESAPEVAAYAESLLRTLPLKPRQTDGWRLHRTVRPLVKGLAVGSAVAA